MDIKEAKKRAEAKKKENFMLVRFSQDYGSAFVLPHKDGVALLAALANAERLTDTYSSDRRIVPVEKENVLSLFLSAAEYEKIKIANLLGISVPELEDMEKGEA